MPKKYNDPSDKHSGKTHDLKRRNKSHEKNSAAGTSGNCGEVKNRAVNDEVEKKSKETKHHKCKPKDKNKKRDRSEKQLNDKKLSEPKYTDSKDIESREKSKKTKHKDKSVARESVFSNIENYLKSLSRTPQIQKHRSHSSEEHNDRRLRKNHQDLRREKTIHVIRTKDNHSLKMQQEKHIYSREEHNRKRSKSANKRSKRNDSEDKHLFYCQIETSSPFQPPENRSKVVSSHNKKHREKNHAPENIEVHSKDITGKVRRKKHKGDRNENIDIDHKLITPEMKKENVHKRKKSRTNIVEESRTVSVLEVEPCSEHKKHRNHKQSEEIRSRPRRKKSCIENNAREVSHPSRCQFQDKIEDDLKSYFIRIQNLIDRKLETILQTNTSIMKIKEADAVRDKTANKKMESREKSRHRQSNSEKQDRDCKFSNKDELDKGGMREKHVGHKHRKLQLSEQVQKSEMKIQNREASLLQNAPERTKIEDIPNDIISTHTKRKHDSPIRNRQGPSYSSKNQKKEVSPRLESPVARIDCFNFQVETTIQNKHDFPPSKKNEEPYRGTTGGEKQQYHSKMPKDRPTKEKHKREIPRDINDHSRDNIRENNGESKSRERSKHRVSELPVEEPNHPKEECDSFRVEGIEPPNLEGGNSLRNKKSRKLECKTVSIIGIPSQMREEYTKYACGLEEALERKKKSKRFKLYYKYTVGGANGILVNNLHASGEKSIVSESFKFTSDHSEDNSNQELVKDEQPIKSVEKNDNTINGQTTILKSDDRNIKCVRKSIPNRTDGSASNDKTELRVPEVQCRYFKALLNSSSECSIKSKKKGADADRFLKERASEQATPPEKKTETSCHYNYWNSETVAEGHQTNLRYFLPDPVNRYDNIYTNKKFQYNLSSKSDVDLSYNSAKTSSFSDEMSSIEYARRNKTIFDESNIYNSPSISRRNYIFPEQNYQQTKMFSGEYNARIEKLLTQKVQSNSPPRYDYFSKHWCSPVFLGSIEPICQKYLMSDWTGTGPKVSQQHPETVVLADNFGEEVIPESRDGGDKVYVSDMGGKFDKFTFVSNQNISTPQKISTVNKHPIDMMTQKYETCDVGTEIKSQKTSEERSTKEVAVEVDEKMSPEVRKIDVGINVRKTSKDLSAEVKRPEVIPEEVCKIIQPKENGKEKSVLTKKRKEIIKSKPPTYNIQECDIARDISTPDTVTESGENTVDTEKKKSETSKVPIRKHKRADLKTKSCKSPDTKAEHVEKNCVDVDETQTQNCKNNLRTGSRSSKRSATAHTFTTYKEKPHISETKWDHSLGGKCGRPNNLKKSQSEISFRKLNLDTEESRIATLACMQKFLNDTKFDVSSKSNTHSLDRYFGKSISSEPHTSTFFLTKDYKTSDVSSYQRRKMYDEIIRRKMRRRKVHDKSLAPQVFEVRFLTVDTFQNRPTKNIIIREESSISGSSFGYLNASEYPKKEVSQTPQSDLANISYSDEYITTKIIEEKILDLCKEMILNRNLLAVQSKFIMDDHKSLEFISSCEFCESRPNFMNFVDCLCKTLLPRGVEEQKHDHSNRKPRTDSDEEIYDSKGDANGNDVELRASEEILLTTRASATMNLSLTGHTSCPALESQGSFKYLYQSELHGENDDNNAIQKYRRPMHAILGFSLKSDTYLHKYPENFEKICIEDIVDSSSSNESGYGSTSKNSSSFLNFFKRPKIAALLEPQSDEELYTKKSKFNIDTSTHLRMMKKCHEYAQKVMIHSQLQIDADEVYEEIPLDILLSKINLPNRKAFGSQPYLDQKRIQLQRYSEPVMNLESPLSPTESFLSDLKSNTESFSVRNDNQEVSLIYENWRADKIEKNVDAKSFKCLAVTPSLESVVSTVGPNVDEEFAQKILVSDFVISNINLCTCCITLHETAAQSKYEAMLCYNTLNPIRLRRMMVRKFFENLLAVYEKDNVFTSTLMEKNNFFETDLLSLINPSGDNKTRYKDNLHKSSVGNRMIKFIAKKIFNSKGSQGTRNLPPIVQPPERSTEGEQVDEYWRENLRSLARNARKYFSMYVQAVRVNQRINDELKICGFQKLLDTIEQGNFRFCVTTQKIDFENEITSQVKRAFCDMYLIAVEEARKNHRTLSSNDLKLIGVFVCKYRIGLLSHNGFIAAYIGKGFFETEAQLKGAVMYLMKNVDINVEEFKKYCEEYQ